MAETVCPTCHSPIDPVSAIARIRGDKVRNFCSSACADTPDEVRAKLSAVTLAGPDGPARAKRSGDERSDIFVRPRSSRKRQIIALSAIIMIGGMAITIINAVSPSTPSDVSAAANVTNPRPVSVEPIASLADQDARPGPATDVDEPPVEALDVSPEALLERATSTLRELLSSPSSRVQRIAGTALARTGDPQALAHLKKLIAGEHNSLIQIDIAYALARAGDYESQKRLRRRLTHDRRDVRIDAARALVQLGDELGRKLLRRMLSLRTHRLGIAGLLARAGDKAGIKALRAALDDNKASAETRMRAVVELGRAGDATVRDKLIEILQDGRYQVGAADALAALGDRAAIPALTRQLDIESLRVRAAIGLRRLGAEVDLHVLAAVLDTGSDQARVSAAEAILILTGPKQLSEFD